MRSGNIFGLALMVLSLGAQAQVDPNSALLLNRGGREGAADSGLDSGRYTVRPKTDSQQRRETTSPQPARKSTGSPEGTTQQTTVIQTQSTSVQTTQQTSSPDQPAIPIFLTVPQSEADVVANQTQPPAAPSQPAAKPQPGRRLNIIELSIAPSFIYNGSESTYAYRTYNMASPAVGADAIVWLSPYFGVQAGYTLSLSGHVSDSLNVQRSVPATHQWTTVGLRSRKFFMGEGGVARLVLGLDYYDYLLKVPNDSTMRARLGSTGVLASAEAEIPVNASRAWTVGFQFAPKLQHKETATAVNFKSGGNPDTNLVGISFGGRLRFDYNDSLFWRVTHSIEKNLFSGNATSADPVTGLTPTGVGVTNSFTSFQFGYTWGN